MSFVIPLTTGPLFSVPKSWMMIVSDVEIFGTGYTTQEKVLLTVISSPHVTNLTLCLTGNEIRVYLFLMLGSSRIVRCLLRRRDKGCSGRRRHSRFEKGRNHQLCLPLRGLLIEQQAPKSIQSLARLDPFLCVSRRKEKIFFC